MVVVLFMVVESVESADLVMVRYIGSMGLGLFIVIWIVLKRRIDDAILAMGNGIKTITPSEMGVIKKLRG